MSSSILNIVNATVDWVTATLDAPSSRAVIFGFPIGGSLPDAYYCLYCSSPFYGYYCLLSKTNVCVNKVLFNLFIAGHLFVEVLLFLVIVYLFSQNSYRPPRRPLTEQEKDELCEEWAPEPLIPSITKEKLYEPPVLESAAGPHTIINGKEVVNFASANYLGLIGHEKLLESCTSALEKYGVGSCGPRGFYGTIDVHLDCEARIANFLGTPDSILYSYGLSAMFSAIPAFAKKGDIIVVDEGVHWGIQNGLHLSRSTIKYFKHNDMEDLRKILKELTSNKKSERVKKLRRYIVVEAVYQNSGQIAPLDKIVELKEKYKFRVLLDESNSFGVLGKSGRGLTEYCRIPVEKIDIITAAMGHALATEGGFCTGSARVTDHQRLSSSGYVFSASLPPYLASAAITAIDILEENPDLITKLKKNIAELWKGLSGIRGLSFASSPESPIVFLRLEKADSLKNELQLQLLQNIANSLLKEHSIFVVTSQKSTLDKCRLPLGIRLFVSAGHTESDLLKAAASLKSVAELVLKDHI